MPRRDLSRMLALALPLFSISAAHAGGVTAIDPFVGGQSEGFEGFPYGEVPPGPHAIFDGAATIEFDGDPLYYLWVYSPSGDGWSWPIGSGEVAGLVDGVRGMALDGEDPDRAIIEFDSPVTRFGGSWAVSTSAPTIAFRFLDRSGAPIDEVQIAYDAVAQGGALVWHGWSSAVPIARIEIQGNYAAFDGLQITAATACAEDLDGDDIVGVTDLLTVLGSWGASEGDVTGDGTTDIADLLALLAAWGSC